MAMSLLTLRTFSDMAIYLTNIYHNGNVVISTDGDSKVSPITTFTLNTVKNLYGKPTEIELEEYLSSNAENIFTNSDKIEFVDSEGETIQFGGLCFTEPEITQLDDGTTAYACICVWMMKYVNGTLNFFTSAIALSTEPPSSLSFFTRVDSTLVNRTMFLVRYSGPKIDAISNIMIASTSPSSILFLEYFNAESITAIKVTPNVNYVPGRGSSNYLLPNFIITFGTIEVFVKGEDCIGMFTYYGDNVANILNPERPIIVGGKNGSYLWFSDSSTIDSAIVNVTPKDGSGIDSFTMVIGVEPEVPSGPYDPGGTSTGGGGGGSFDYPGSFDQIGETPVGSAEADSSSLGIFTRYLMSQSSLTRFGDYLYSDNLIDAVVMELMKLLYSTPAEALISLISYPFNVSSLLSSTPSNVFFGNGDTGIASDGRLTKTAAQINWGSILVKGWTGSFLDFSPHTKFDLYLPWCTGTVSLDPSEILTDRSTGISGDVATGQIQIRTNIEIAKGTCMHMVYNGDGVCLGTYSGVCGSQLPITALDTSGKALAFVTAAVSTIASGAAAAAGAAMGGMASSARTAGAFSPMSEASQLKQATLNGGHSPAVPNYSRGIAGAQAVSRGAARVAVDSARAAAITPPSISRNGSFTANGSGMSIQYPYLIVSYPERDVPEKYSSHYGYPSNIYKQLGSLNGYTEVAAIHLDGISCTEPELSELDELLKGGVIL